MNYFECRIKILELKREIFKLKEERDTKQKVIKRKAQNIDTQAYEVLKKLKDFYLDGYKRGILHVHEFTFPCVLLHECYGADVMSGSTEYMQRYNAIKYWDYSSQYSYMLQLYIDIVKKFGTCNMNLFDPTVTEYVLDKIPSSDSKVVEAVGKITQDNMEYQAVSQWFRDNIDILKEIKHEWDVVNSDNEDEKLLENFYDEQIKELQIIINELEEYSKKLKEAL